MDITVEPLTADLIKDYLSFFDNIVFTENPDWSKCYCYSFHFTGPDEQWNKENNRAAVVKLIQEDGLKGYLAFSNNIPIAWCNANDRDNFQRLRRTYHLDDSSQKICSIVCFLIHPDYRGKGIAKLLLERIIKDYTSGDYEYLEVYPAKGESSCEKNYKGPLSLYEQYGFKIVNEFDRYYVLRKSLKPDRIQEEGND